MEHQLSGTPMDQDDRYARITLRIPRDLHANLTAEAERKTRSMNAEIISILEEKFQASEANYKEELLYLRKQIDHIRNNMVHFSAHQTDFFVLITLLSASLKEKLPDDISKKYDDIADIISEVRENVLKYQIKSSA